MRYAEICKNTEQMFVVYSANDPFELPQRVTPYLYEVAKWLDVPYDTARGLAYYGRVSHEGYAVDRVYIKKIPNS